MTIQEWLGTDNQLGIDIWERKYQHNGETFDEWIERVSNGNEDVAQLIREKKFLFGGRILANRGLDKRGKKISLSNCYVIAPPEDNIESIFDCATKLARTYSYGGGCGVDISKLAPTGAHVNNAAETTSGATSFMDLYSLVTELIGQQGRRGALMISIDCHHPDLTKFITIKSDLDKVTKANISVRITDDFMRAVEKNEDFMLEFHRPESNELITKEVNARDVFHMLCEQNWNYAEPGMLFWDRIKHWNLLTNTKEFEFAGTNPCAEEPLPAGGSCLLGSINLAEFVMNPFTKNAQFDMESFKDTVKKSTVALNEVLDEGLPLHPLQEQRDSVRNWRQIGLGVMGIADMLIKLGISYNSHEAVSLCDEIGFVMANYAIRTSARLAKEYGSYPKYKASEVTSTDFFIRNTDEDTRDLVFEYGMRNSQLLTIAPTGTLSTMLGISGGIEPIFMNTYKRKTQSLYHKDVYYDVYTPICQKYLDMTGETKLPDYFVESHNIDPMNRISMQGIWQNHIDASISSTINLPNSATVEDIMKIYMQAWIAGLKGVTVYRDGCARSGILVSDVPEKADETDTPTLKRGDIIQCSYDLVGKKRKLQTGCGSLHCLAYFDPCTGDLMETYLSKGSTGGCDHTLTGLSRMISLAARAGVNINDIVDQLNSTGSCPSYAVRRAVHKDTSQGSCCPMAVGNAILSMYQEMQNEIYYDEDTCEEATTDVITTSSGDTKSENVHQCPECGAEIRFEGGCNLCPSCGWSKCG